MTLANRIVSILLEDDHSLDSFDGNDVYTDARANQDNRIERLLADTRKSFIDNRMRGYTNRAGRRFPPVSQQEAEAAWERIKPQMDQKLRTDPTLKRHHFTGLRAHRPGPAFPDRSNDPGNDPGL
jgi:hypothetical protein